jgi:hypothetical protein
MERLLSFARCHRKCVVQMQLIESGMAPISNGSASLVRKVKVEPATVMDSR